MININDKSWDSLEYNDIKEWLGNFSKADGQENFFFEFKSDGVSNSDLVKEVSAFSNTYGGYILIGVDDDKTVVGCKDWKEERILSTIYDSITPLPVFEIKTFQDDSNTEPIIVVRIEAGPMPPYITNKGKIFERVSSGSIPINNSAKLAQLYKRNSDNTISIGKAIELPDIYFERLPDNMFGYIDLGFHIEVSDQMEMRSKWINIGSSDVIDYVKTSQDEATISRVGDVYSISIGRAEAKDPQGNVFPLRAGVNDFVEISNRGSVRSRIILRSNPDDFHINLANVEYCRKHYEELYNKLFGEGISKHFIYARKYEKITVLKQFVPMYAYDSDTKGGLIFNQYLDEHKDKYGGNLVIEGNRIPSAGYTLIDREYFDNFKLDYSDESIIEVLFFSKYCNLGFIDLPKDLRM